jgi:hypothetical protein
MLGYRRTKLIGADKLGLNGVAIIAAKTSNTIDLEAFSQMTVEIAVTWAAATKISFYLEISEDASAWHRMNTIDSIAGGAITLSNAVYEKAIAASLNYFLDIPITYKYARLVISCDGAGADSAIVQVRLGAN